MIIADLRTGIHAGHQRFAQIFKGSLTALPIIRTKRMGPPVRPAVFFLGYCLSLLACAVSRARDRSPRELSRGAAYILLAEAIAASVGLSLGDRAAGKSLAAHRLCKLAGPAPSCSSVLVPQFCTGCPQADRNRSATKHERDTGPLALCHSPVAGPSPRRNKGLNSVSLLHATAASKGPHSRSRHFSAAAKPS